MKILVSGASGLVGFALRASLLRKGHHVFRLVRNQPLSANDEIYWNPSEGILRSQDLEGFDAVVHLAGENVATGRWTQKKKRAIFDSRVQGTTLLSTTLGSLQKKPKVFVCASAVGYYGDQGDALLDENASLGNGFLAQVCKDWEKASRPAQQSGIRTVHLRIGIVLSWFGGALEQMLPIFDAGLGGVLGKGNQWMSWITLEDLVRTIEFSIENANLVGPVNAVSPNPVSNKEFTRSLSHHVKKPAIFGVPGPLACLGLGQMAKELLLASFRVHPKKLLEHGFSFQSAHLDEALYLVLKNRLPWQKRFSCETFIPKKREELFPFFCDPKNLEAITPPWLKFRILSQTTPSTQTGTEYQYQLKIHGVPVRWKTRIRSWNPNHSFSDEQLKGPYKKWFHTHEFFDHNNGTRMTDVVDYTIPMGAMGTLLLGLFIRRDIETIFRYRNQKILQIFQ